MILLCALLPAVAQTDSIPPADASTGTDDISLLLGPWVFTGYRSLVRHPKLTEFPDAGTAARIWRDIDREHRRDLLRAERAEKDSILAEHPDSIQLLLWDPYESIEARERDLDRELPPVASGEVTPPWLERAIRSNDIQLDLMYHLMVYEPHHIQYAYWDLPVPPRLPEEDYSFHGYLKRLNLPEVDVTDAVIKESESPGRYNWLHVFNTGLQLSQAYVSDNWYQGGNSYLAFLFNFLWDVQLNTVFHPNMMFQSTLSYKFAINSSPDDQYHKYSISQDIFQYNLKTGYKAAHNWYYSFLLQFKTQFFNSYPSNSEQRSASFLSPGELNLGLGMTYTKETADKRLKLSASVSPLSYNFKSCIDPEVEHSQFNIRPDRRWVNEIGCNAELTLLWNIWDNISYSTRLFLFSDYESFQGDWESTFNFQFNRYFSTQLYFHLRYDSEADGSIAPNWNKWMLKEILSVGISYSFSTK